MARRGVQLRSSGMRAMLEGAIGREIAERAGKNVEEAARALLADQMVERGKGGQPTRPVPVDGYLDTHGRPSYFVGIPHPAGLAIEAKHRPLGSALGSAHV